MQKYNNGLFIFHRDFRIVDNIGLLNASKYCEKIYVCFIFTPDQVGKINTYRSQNAIQFMIESLEDVSDEIEKKGGQLMIFYGKQDKIIGNLIDDLNIDCVYFNKDYTPYAINRDNSTYEFCKKKNIECYSYDDYYLYEPNTVKTISGTFYKKFTPFYEEVVNRKVENPLKITIKNFAKKATKLDNALSLEKAFELFTKANPKILVHGGRALALKRLKGALVEQNNYDKTRDFFIQKTTLLSSYIKFGCVSIREVYHAFKEKYGIKNGIIRELIWREFFAHVLYAYPEVIGQSYQPVYRNIKWRNSVSDFTRWCKGETGFPLVDACMCQLNTTGYMHNRGRMIVADFLVKTLLLDWRLGEKYFAQKLTDYDIASNNGNWQGISGTGVDMKPYFRNMNSWIQSKKFDKNAEYIKKWIPELNDVEPNDIHKWNIACNDEKYKHIKYYKPMIDYIEQKEKMLEMYSNALSK